MNFAPKIRVLNSSRSNSRTLVDKINKICISFNTS